MRLNPREQEKLQLHYAGFLAQKRLARGLRLNHPEAVALIAAQILEFIRDGRSVAQLMDLGRSLLGRNQVLSSFLPSSTLSLSLFFHLRGQPCVSCVCVCAVCAVCACACACR
jgi:urease gamma subunit